MNGRIRAALVMVVALALLDCRARSSPEYWEAEADCTVLVAKRGDAAYTDPQMKSVVARLKAVPAKALEARKAAELLAKIDAETQRVAADDEAAAAMIATAARGTVAPPSFGNEKVARPAAPQPQRLVTASPRAIASLQTHSGWNSAASGYEVAKAEQRSSDCPMVVYFRVDWCPFCKQFDTAIAPSGEVASGLATAVKVTVESEMGDAQKALSSQFGVTGYPSVFLVTGPDAAPIRLDTGVGRGKDPKPAELVEDYRRNVTAAWSRAASDSLTAGRLDDAIARADRLIAFEPHAPDGYGLELRAEAFRKKADWPAALRDFQLACASGCTRCCSVARDIEAYLQQPRAPGLDGPR